MKIVERLMGLLLTAVAIQFAINGFIELGVLPPLPKISSP
jgi:small neutral amino acid transporter SnatA (MarC family)